MELIQEQVDIYSLPPLDTKHIADKEIEITIGDLHGNAMKLLFMLVKHGVATHISQENYKKLVAIYKMKPEQLTQDDLKEFNLILEKAKFNSAKIRMIGDELCDRGSNDYFTLKLLEKLSAHHISYEALISNHSADFIEAYEKQSHFHPAMLHYQHAQSMEHLNQLIDRGLVSREEILNIINSAYKPALRVLSYALSENKSEITLYSHAGIGLETVQKLSVRLGVAYQDKTAQALADTIEEINRVFQQHVNQNTIHTLYTRMNMQNGYNGNADINAPFEFLMWNRNYDALQRPFEHHGYRINFVHGHDKADVTKDHIITLDTDLGKALHVNQGEYLVLFNDKNATSASQLLDSKTLLKKYQSYMKNLDEFIEQHPKNQSELNRFKRSIEQSVNHYFKQVNRTKMGDPVLLDKQMKVHVHHIQQKLQYEKGLWRNLHPIIKGILGVLALLTVIPALVVQITAPRGFWGTFFMPAPPTEISNAFKQQHLDEVPSGLNRSLA